MGPLDAFWQVANLFLPALALGALAATLAKLLWRRELAGVPWRRLAAPASAAGAAVLLGGLLLFGRDGKTATYAALVLANAFILWWQGFGPGRQ